MSSIPGPAGGSWKSVSMVEAARSLESSGLEKLDKRAALTLAATLSAPKSVHTPVPRAHPPSAKMSIEFLLAPEVYRNESAPNVHCLQASFKMRDHSTPQESCQILTGPASPISASSPTTPSRDRPHACPECRKLFLKKHHLRSHLETHYNRKRHACNLLGCQSAFTRVHDLQRHQKTVHQKDFSQSEGMRELNFD